MPVTVNIYNSAVQSKKECYNYREADWANFQRITEATINAEVSLNTTSDIDTAIMELESCIKNTVSTCRPRVKVRARLIQLDDEAKALISQKNMLRRQYHRKGDRNFYSAFRQAAKRIEERLRNLNNQRFSKIVKNFPKNSLPFWRISKLLRSKFKPIPALNGNLNLSFTPQ
uniref:Syntaxin N-terminal domain-containing protein n=1 Tax=Anopheles culicifacies TaxID=139723 RepID=A0A182MKX3_9DIPT